MAGSWPGETPDRPDRAAGTASDGRDRRRCAVLARLAPPPGPSSVRV